MIFFLQDFSSHSGLSFPILILYLPFKVSTLSLICSFILPSRLESRVEPVISGCTRKQWPLMMAIIILPKKLMDLLFVIYFLINHTPCQSIPEDQNAIGITGVSSFKGNIYHVVVGCYCWAGLDSVGIQRLFSMNDFCLFFFLCDDHCCIRHQLRIVLVEQA